MPRWTLKPRWNSWNAASPGSTSPPLSGAGIEGRQPMLAAERCRCRVGEGESHHSVVRSVQSRIPTVLLAGRRTGPVFLTDRNAKPSVALVDVDP